MAFKGGDVKERKPANVTLRIVGHRSRLNRQWRLSPRQWRTAIGVGAGVVPLLLAFGVYGFLQVVIPHSLGDGMGVPPAAAAHADWMRKTNGPALPSIIGTSGAVRST